MYSLSRSKNNGNCEQYSVGLVCGNVSATNDVGKSSSSPISALRLRGGGESDGHISGGGGRF